jgi:hypothetical protein
MRLAERLGEIGQRLQPGAGCAAFLLRQRGRTGETGQQNRREGSFPKHAKS